MASEGALLIAKIYSASLVDFAKVGCFLQLQLKATELIKISDWFKINKLKLNLDKTNFI